MSNIIVPTNAGIGGYFRLEVRHKGVLVRQLSWFRNLILNHGLSMWRKNDINGFTFQLGTSNAPPAVTDSGLLAPVGTPKGPTYPLSKVVNKTAPPYYTEDVYKVVFPENTIVGNLAEVGVYANSKSGPGNSGWFSRSLLKDSGGNPTVITVLPMEEVTMYYALRLYDDVGDSSGTFALGAESYNYTSYGCTSPEYIGRMDLIQHGLSRGDASTGSGSLQIRLEHTPPADLRSNTTTAGGFVNSSGWSGNAANTGMVVAFIADYGNNMPGDADIKSIFLYNRVCSPRRYVFDPPIPKDPTRKITFKLEFTGDRY